jgi:hypothetical protein
VTLNTSAAGAVTANVQILLHRTSASRNASDNQLITLPLNFCAKLLRHLDCSFTVATWSIASQMGNTISKSSRDDSTLSKTLRSRHRKSRSWRYKSMIPIDSPLHISSGHLARGGSFVLRKGSIRIWSATFQALDTRSTTSLTHAESDEIGISRLI